MAIIAPSLLSANFLNLAQDCEMLDRSEAEWFHIDVMDGRFVPNISFGAMILDYIRSTTAKICDVHLMIEEPGRYAEVFQKAGADNLTVHLEACPHLHRNIQQIKSLGIRAGVAINPHTPVHLLEDILPEIDLVCIMSVNPGFGGQTFIPGTLNKIVSLKEMILQKNLKVLLEVDGGINADNAHDVITAGADILVAGNAVFKAADPTAMIKILKAL